MNRVFILAFLSLGVFVACNTKNPGDSGSASSGNGPQPYQPVTKPEQKEFANDRLDFYPDDFRKDPAAHPGVMVVWAGVIRSTDARERDNGLQIYADTVFEHHYFDWVQERGPGGLQLAVSPRGEGLFKMRWILDKKSDDSTAESAEKFASPGKLAIVYGVPERVDPDGTVVLHYKYIRIIDEDHFNTNEFDYGRLGEPFHSLPPRASQPYATPGKGG